MKKLIMGSLLLLATYAYGGGCYTCAYFSCQVKINGQIVQTNCPECDGALSGG